MEDTCHQLKRKEEEISNCFQDLEHLTGGKRMQEQTWTWSVASCSSSWTSFFVHALARVVGSDFADQSLA